MNFFQISFAVTIISAFLLTIGCTCVREPGYKTCGWCWEYDAEDREGSHADSSTLEPQQRFWFLDIGAISAISRGPQVFEEDPGDGIIGYRAGFLRPIGLFEVGAGGVLAIWMNGSAEANYTIGNYAEGSWAFYFFTPNGLLGSDGGALRLATTMLVTYQPKPDVVDISGGLGLQFDLTNFRLSVVYAPTWRFDQSVADLDGFRHAVIIRMSYAL